MVMSTDSDESGASDDSTSSTSSEDGQPLPAEMKAVDTNVMDQDSVRGSASREGADYFGSQ
jgi:hypothetical protein